MVEALLGHGAHANDALDTTGATALMTCARSGSAAAVRLLVAHGADVNAVGDGPRSDGPDVGDR